MRAVPVPSPPSWRRSYPAGDPANGGAGGQPSGDTPGRPAITVVVATRNRAADLARTLGRLVRLPERPALIVAGKASTDGTAAQLPRPPLRRIRPPRWGRTARSAGRYRVAPGLPRPAHPGPARNAPAGPGWRRAARRNLRHPDARTPRAAPGPPDRSRSRQACRRRNGPGTAARSSHLPGYPTVAITRATCVARGNPVAPCYKPGRLAASLDFPHLCWPGCPAGTRHPPRPRFAGESNG